jgi:protein-S-isoprenylcysteine O-methyltransferase Ste14
MMNSTIVVWLMIIVYFVGDFGLRKGKNASSFEAGKRDQKTSFLLRLTYGAIFLAILLSPILNNYHIGQIDDLQIEKWVGFAMMLMGFAIRTWAMLVLGKFYTRTLRTKSDQPIVEQGPYRVIRHPGYLGSLLFWIGAGLATANWIVAGGITITLVFAYRSRIQAEETMLLATFGQAYKDYSQRTWKLIPYIL